MTPPTLTAASTATVDAPFTVTFTDDATWRSAISTTGIITVDGTTLSSSAYSVSAGQITFTPSASTLLQSAGTKSIVVSATGYSNATVSQTIGAGAATKLSMQTQPSGANTTYGTITTQPAVRLLDQYNNNVSQSGVVITASSGTNCTPAGTTTASTNTSGVATFSGLGYTSTAASSSATLTFTSGTLTSAISNTFAVLAPPPSNDQCSGAIAIPASGPFPFLTTAVSNATATTTGDPTPTCPTSFSRSIWYSFTPSVSASYRFSMCPADAPGASAFDQVLAVYSSSNNQCNGTLTSLACNDDAGAAGCAGATTNSVISSVALTAGTTYFIVPSSLSSNSGTVQIQVSQLPAPTISGLSATTVCPGTAFTVTGTNLGGVTSATVGGVTATVSNNTAGSVDLTVASAASGTVSITCTNGSVTSSSSIDVAIPAAPATPTSSSVSSSGFTAQWGAVTGAANYQLDVSTSPTFSTPANTLLVTWTFPSTSADIVADGGIASNTSRAISTTANGTTSYLLGSLGSPDQSISNDNWSSGNGTKWWQVDFSSTGYSGLTVSSKQQSSNTGPRDFKVQYRIGTGGTWTDVPSASVTVANNFTAGVLSNVALPSACDDQAQVFLRWIMTSNTAVGGASVASGGSSRIDDIVINASSTPSFVPGYNSLSVSGTSQPVTVPAAGTYFARVRSVGNGACSSSNSGTLTVVAQDPTYTVSITRSGTGGGTISSSPVGISCGAVCSFAFPQGTPVELSASADAGSYFVGWSGGGCSGTGTCTVSSAQSVTAEFATCPAGSYCSGGTAQPQPCLAGFYSGTGQSSCTTCATCPAGEYASTACSSTTNAVCSTCPSLSNCVSVSCTSAADPVCLTCASGFALQPDGTCAAISTDDDNDGVDNSSDACAGTPLGEAVSATGCSCSQVTVSDGDACTQDVCVAGVVSHPPVSTTVTLSASPTATPVAQGTASAVLLDLTFARDACTNSIQLGGADVHITGTVQAGDLSNFRLVHDVDNSGSLSASDVVLSSVSSFTPGTALSFTLSPPVDFTSDAHLLVVAAVSNATPNQRTCTCALGSYVVSPSPPGTVVGSATGNTITFSSTDSDGDGIPDMGDDCQALPGLAHFTYGTTCGADPGYYITLDANGVVTAVTECPPGFYCLGGTSTQGFPCSMGFFQGLPGQSSCTPAPAGSFVDQTGAISAEPCPAGTYSNVTASVVCQACSGSTNVPVGATICSTLSYGTAPLCTGGGTRTPTLSGTSGGTFSYTCGLPPCTGLALSSSTGAIDLDNSAPGTYSVCHSDGACATVEVNANITSSLTISIDGLASPPTTHGTCDGSPVLFSVLQSSGGGSAPTYVWRKDGSVVQSSSSSSYTDPGTSAGTVTCDLVSSDACTSTGSSNAIALSVTPGTSINPTTLAITQTQGTNPACSGSPVEFRLTGAYTDGSSATNDLSAVWSSGTITITGTPFGFTASSSSSVSVSSVSSSRACVSNSPLTSNLPTPVSLSVTPSVTMGPVSVALHSGTNPACSGSSVEFRAAGAFSDGAAYGSTETFVWSPNVITITGTPFRQLSSVSSSAVHSVTVSSARACVSGSSSVSSSSSGGDLSLTVSIPTLWYADTDNDGAGDPNDSQLACTQPSGFVANGNDECPGDGTKILEGFCGCGNPETNTDSDALPDCVDGCPNDGTKIDPGVCGCGNPDVSTTWYADDDSDGYGDPTDGIGGFVCAQPSGRVSNSSDCDDTRNTVYPGAPEMCDGRDNDCNGGIPGIEIDNDGDGYVECTIASSGWTGSTLVIGGEDCDDSNMGRNPGAAEVCDASNVDEDCDGLVNEGFPTDDYALDGDADNHWVSGSVVTRCSPPSSAHRLVSVMVLAGGGPGDCDDTDDDRFPGRTEECDDKDNDCDALTAVDLGCDDDNDNWCDASMTVASTGCSTCTSGPGDCDDTNAVVNPGEVEVCDASNVDEDCDGFVNEGFPTFDFALDADNDNFYVTGSVVTRCGPPSSAHRLVSVMVSAGGGPGDCDDTDDDRFPGRTEECDDKDNDCDALTAVDLGCDDDNDNWCDASMTVASTGCSTCTSGPGDCDDTNAVVNPGEVEVCDASNVDEDCDGLVNEGFPTDDYALDGDADNYWVSGSVVTRCGPPSSAHRLVSVMMLAGGGPGDCDDTDDDVHPGSLEVCGNSKDDDCDGVTDPASLWVLDADNDGYYTGGASSSSCAPSSLHRLLSSALGGGDCDDSNASIRPGATEVCDGVDQDCDLVVDEGVQTTWVVDADNDGYYVTGSDVLACNAPSIIHRDLATRIAGGDCDDADDDVHPGTTEVCGNGIDDDCDGVGGPLSDDDGDGISNSRELQYGSSSCAVDSDSDGVTDGMEWGGALVPRDSDGDGLYDVLDPDDDGDGVPTALEGLANTDGDALPNYLDDDDDGDGIATLVEGSGDPDNDGVPNRLDEDSDGDTIEDSEEYMSSATAGLPPAPGADTDGDGTLDFLDLDSDNDGVADVVEAGDALLATPAVHSDADGIPDYRDSDSDNDLVGDGTDNCRVTSGQIGSTCSDGNALTINDVVTSSCTCVGTYTAVVVDAKLFLDGAYDATTGLMRDDLRFKGLLPSSSPYGAAPTAWAPPATFAPGVITIVGSNAVVDWVVVELRNAVDPSVIEASRAALVQRDGDVVDVDGVSPVVFPTSPLGSYHVAVRHRNHLGTMTAAPVVFGPAPVVVDFRSPALACYGAVGAQPRKVHATTGAALLWAGNAHVDNRLRYTNVNNDRDAMLVYLIQTYPGQNNNAPATATSVVTNVYTTNDVTMDGNVMYTGGGNDRDPILTNINYGLSGTSTTRQRLEQLP